ncbi:MAG: hypothetical protein J6D09_05720 [Clostridia bacterium]|nr:hypothetical protein [Clostridia bacterium]
MTLKRSVCILSFALAVLSVITAFGCGGKEKVKKIEPIETPAFENKYKHDETFTDHIWGKKNIDEILASEYQRGMPLGYNDLVFSFYQPGWGFNNSSIHANTTLTAMSYDDSKLINTGWGMPIQVKINDRSVSVKDAFYTPSVVTSHYESSKGVVVTGYKYVSTENMIAVMIEVKNGSDEKVKATVKANLNGNVYETSVNGNALNATFRRDNKDVLDIVATGDGFKAKDKELTASVEIAPGEAHTFKLGAAFDRKNADKNILQAFFKDKDPIKTQRTSFNAWFEYNIPYIDLPDESMEQIYYYRWHTYRSQIRLTTSNTYVITEFLPNVAWARNDNAIVCAAGHHIYEGRWLRDQKYIDDYMQYWFVRGSSAIYLYTSWLPEAFYQRYLTSGDESISRYYKSLEGFYNRFTSTHYDDSFGLYKINGGSEGMETSVSDPSNKYRTYRPTFNSYMYANALAIAEFAKMQGDNETYEKFILRASEIKTAMEKLWDGSFYRGWHDGEDTYCDVRELIGYAPWMFNMPNDDAEHAEIWKYLMDPDYFYAEYGPLTAEREKAILELYDRHCKWNGPSWPFATTQTLIAMANVIRNYENQSYVDADDYFTLLRNYALTHYNDVDGDGVRETPWIGESLLPDSGEWIQITERSSYYNHSQYTNLLITGLLGITPDSGDELKISPLVPKDWEYFCLENLPYHGKNVTIIYDKDGSRYGEGAGLKVYVDGVLAEVSETLCEITVSLSK